MNSLPSDNDLRDAFQSALDYSGFSFENEVEKIFKKNNFDVEREVPFLDKDEQKGRQIDFIIKGGVLVDRVGIYNTNVNSGELRLVVECKSHPNYGWVFFEGKHFEDKPAEEMYFKEPKLRDYKYLPKPFIKELFFASSYTEFVYDADKKRTTRNSPEVLFEAVAQVTKATRHQIDYEKKILNVLLQRGFSYKDAKSPWDFIILQPLIIFGGNLYKVNENGKLESINFAQIDKKWISKNYEETFGEIHIVTFKALQNYIDILRDHYDFVNNPKSKTDLQYKKLEEKIKLNLNNKRKKKNWWNYFKLK